MILTAFRSAEAGDPTLQNDLTDGLINGDCHARSLFEKCEQAVAGKPRVTRRVTTHRTASSEPRFSAQRLIRAAMARHPDTLFVLAAGNGNTQLGGPGLEPDHFLATMHAANVVIVANANRDGRRFQASFDGSNFGTPYVDVAMRGMDLPLAIASGAYGRSRGTSSATPNVAAVAARIRLIDPSLTASEVKQLLIDTVQPQSAWAGLANAGGTVDQARAIRAAAGL